MTDDDEAVRRWAESAGRRLAESQQDYADELLRMADRTERDAVAGTPGGDALLAAAADLRALARRSRGRAAAADEIADEAAPE